MTVIDLSAIKDADFAKAVNQRAVEMKANAEEAGRDDATTIENVEGDKIVLKDDKTETAFWVELLAYTLANGDAFDNFLAGKPITDS